MKVRLSAAARDYMRHETVYLRARSPAAAKNFVARMKTARGNIGSYAMIGKRDDELPVP